MPDGSGKKGCLVCIPTYDELENLPGIVPAVFDVMPAANVLIIDDNSPDGTGDLADAMAKEDLRVHVLHRRGKEGSRTVMSIGFKSSPGPLPSRDIFLRNSPSGE